MQKKILVTAAGGNQSKILIPKLAKAGFTVRAMRRSKGADELLAIGASFLQSAFAMGTLHVFHDPDRGQAKTNLDDFTDVVVKIASERERHFAASYELSR